MATRKKAPERGRPEIPEKERRNVQVNARLTDTEYDALLEASEATDRTISSYVRLLILKDLKDKKLL